MRHEVKYQELNDEQLNQVVGGSMLSTVTTLVDELTSSVASVILTSTNSKSTTQNVSINQVAKASSSTN